MILCDILKVFHIYTEYSYIYHYQPSNISICWTPLHSVKTIEQKTMTLKDSSAPHMLYLQLFSWTTTVDNNLKWFKVAQSALDVPLPS